MIQWKKYDPENPPKKGTSCVVTDGYDVFLCYYDPDATFRWVQWYEQDDFNEVTHYAEINLPGEVDHE